MKSRIPRSYLEVNNNINLLEHENIYSADAIIINIDLAANIFSNFSSYKEKFEKFKELGILIFVKIDSKNYKQSMQYLKLLKGEYIEGFAIPRANSSLLNKFNVRVRSFEHANKLNFGSISFIAYIDNPLGVINYRKIASYSRVRAVYIDELRYLNYLGIEKQSINYLREQVSLYSTISKKQLIDSYYNDNDSLVNDLSIGKKLGASSKLTSDINQIELINNFYTPTQEEVNEAKKIFDLLLKTEKKDRKNINIDNLEISEFRIIKAQEVLVRSKELQDDINFVIKNEEIKDASKILQPKKFYTFGEEIANGISHGIGIILSIIFLVLLLMKGSNQGTLVNIAYIIYSLSVFTLYLSSTLYHGLPLGSRAKRLFNKFDHLSIYLLIAGTYTPLTLITIGGKVGITLFTILWAGTAIGVLLNIFHFGKFKLLHMVLYVALGWVAIFYLNTIINIIGPIPTVLLISGGIAYTIGIIFYSLKLFKFTHMVWHIFTILGTILHFLTIYLI